MMTKILWGGGTPSVASRKGCAYDGSDQRDCARDCGSGVSGAHHPGLCGGGRSQCEHRLRDGMDEDCGRPRADRVQQRARRGFDMRRGDGNADGAADSCALPQRIYAGPWRVDRCACLLRNGESVGVYLQLRRNNTKYVGSGDYKQSWRRAGTQQHAAQPGRLPLAAYGVGSAARKGAAA